MTAAMEPSPAAMAKMSTYRMVGTARMTVMKVFIVMLSHGFDRFMAVPKARYSEMTAPMMVDRKASERVTRTCHMAVPNVT